MLRLPLIVPTAAAGQAAVAESLHLLRFPPGVFEEEVSQVVDGIWSLQYLAAGPICGSAGRLVRFHSTGSADQAGAGAEAGAEAQPAVSHAVLFRYANETALTRFEAQPRVQLMLSGTGAPAGTGITTINFRGSVPNELEAIFRRGPEWAAGAELVVALALQGGSGEGDASEFLALTQQLAVSSAFGAVQCSYGPCLSVQHSGGAAAGGSDEGPGGEAAAQQAQQQAQQAQQLPAQQPDMVLLVRFQEEAQLQAFLDCPPIAALVEGDERIPLRALWSATLLTEPSDSSTTQGVRGGLV
ncbi:hypothetical protein ABPG75_014051 [Micractinium tetrahymenae]